MHCPTMLKLLAATLALAAASPAAQAAEFYFRTPSDNIYCGFNTFSGQGEVRCDIKSYTPTLGQPPGDCDLDWGDSFSIGARDKRGSVVCHGDTIISPGAKVISYGTSWSRRGITCAVEETGVTCTNRKGHGFFVSRREQNVF